MHDWSDIFEPETPGRPHGWRGLSIHSSRRFFIGLGRTSANQDWGVGWSQPEYAVLHRGVLAKRARREGVGAADIANDGTYALGTGHSGGTRLSGKCLIFDRNHQLSLEDSYGAMVYDVSCEPEGRFVVCQTCNGNVRGGLLSLYDVGMRSRIFQLETGSIWAEYYSFDTSQQSLTLHFREGRSSTLSFDGSRLEPKGA